MQRSGALHVTFNRIQSLVDLRAARYKSRSRCRSPPSQSQFVPPVSIQLSWQEEQNALATGNAVANQRSYPSQA